MKQIEVRDKCCGSMLHLICWMLHLSTISNLKALTSTDAVFVVPKSKHIMPAPWTVQYTKGMKLLQEVPRHSHGFSVVLWLILTSCNAPLTKHNSGMMLQVYCLNRDTLQLKFDHNQSTGDVKVQLSFKMQVPVIVAGVPTTAILDTAAQGTQVRVFNLKHFAVLMS